MKQIINLLLLITIGVFAFTINASGQTAGIDWVSRNSAADNNWLSVTYGNGLFVAVSTTGSGNRVMTSPDGINWTARNAAADNDWTSVTYGNGLFVAVANTGSGNRVMTSADGINWTIRNSPANNSWRGVTYGNGLFVAVAFSGFGNRVMSSPDGVNWTIRDSPADNNWLSVTYGNGLFVAVANSGSGNRVMTSPDGINWTIRNSPADNNWSGICYGNGLFVAVAISGNGNRVMTSPDGINWTLRNSPADNSWFGVIHGNGLFVAVATTGSGNRVMTSPDGINWTLRNSPADNNWISISYGNGLFVGVAYSGSGNRVMTSGTYGGTLPLRLLNLSVKQQNKHCQLQWTTIEEQNTSHFVIEHSSDGRNFSSIGRIAAMGSVATSHNYSFIDEHPEPGTNYYRLKMIDLDGQFTFSKILIVNSPVDEQIIVTAYPNPAHSNTTLSVIAPVAEPATYTLLDQTGRQLYSINTLLSKGANRIVIDMEQLTAGNYYLLLQGQRMARSIKIIKQ